MCIRDSHFWAAAAMAGSGVGGSGSQEEEGQTGLALCVEPAQIGYQDEVRCRRPPSIALRSSVHMRTNVQTRPVCSVSERQAPASTTALGWGTIPYELSKPLQAELQQVGADTRGFSPTQLHRVAARSALSAASTGPVSAAALQATTEAALLAEQPPAVSCVVLAGV